MASIFSKLGSKSEPKTITTSRPIFQHSTSFLDSDNEDILEKPPISHTRGYDQSFHASDHHNHYNTSSHRVLPPSRIHLILHITNVALSSISTILFLSVIPLWNANFRHTRSIASGDYTDGLVLAPLILSLLGSLYKLSTEHRGSITSCLPCFSTPRAPKPAADPIVGHVRLALLAITILLMLASTLALSATNSLALAWQTSSPSTRNLTTLECNLSNILTRECQPMLYAIGGLQIAGVTFGGLVWSLWLVVFVVSIRGCMREKREKRERQRRRREERERRRRRGHGQGHEHARRHGRRRAHDHKHSHKRDPVDGIEDAFVDLERGDRATSPDGGASSEAVRSFDGVRTFSPSAKNRTPREVVAAPAQEVQSAAAQLASHTIRPKEKIQVWLAGRHT